jgi:hypothetical protein
MKNIISFVSNRHHLTKDSRSVPVPLMKTIPEWYRKADRFAKMPNGEFWKGPDNGKIPTWKACPAIFDIMGTGYALRTPSDLDFFINDEGIIDCRVIDPRCQDFIQKRAPMPQFVHPHGYHEHHFAFWVDWNVHLPEGYSAIYMSPSNRYEIPFMVTEGIIDNDHVNISGTFPFFVQNNFTGIVPAGTVYAQIIPFKREDWSSKIVIENPQNIFPKNQKNSQTYRVPDGGVYKNNVWQQRKYD